MLAWYSYDQSQERHVVFEALKYLVRLAFILIIYIFRFFYKGIGLLKEGSVVLQ